MYTIAKTLSSSRCIELVRIKKFVVVVFDLDNKIFVVYIVLYTSFDLGLEVHPFYKTRIASLKADKTLISVLSKYTAFVNIFSKDLVVKLLKYIRINNYTINLIED